MDSASPGKKDFEGLRVSGQANGITLSIGSSVGSMRDRLAEGLVHLGVTPNSLTIAGFVFTLIGSWYLLRCAGHVLPIDPFAPAGAPRSWYPLAAAAWFFLAAACDMLDGAVARCGRLHSDFGAILDSTVDRFSDIAVWAACALYFAALGNITYCLLTFAALSNTFLISYVKARAEDVIPDCSVGYWQRGERFLATLIGCAAGHMPALIWLLAILPFFTVLRRLEYSRAYLWAQANGMPLPEKGIPVGWLRYVEFWRHPRGSLGCDLAAGIVILYLLAGPPLIQSLYGCTDPVRALLGRLHAW